MFRMIATVVIVIFLAGVFTLLFPAFEDVASHVEDNEAVKDHGWTDKVDSTREILFIGAPLFLIGGTLTYAAVWMIRKEKHQGRRGLR